MLRLSGRLGKAVVTAVARTTNTKVDLPSQKPSLLSPFSVRFYGVNGPDADPVAVQMINYALGHARSQKSDESYAQGLLVLEQCLSANLRDGEDTASENSRAMVLLAMSTLLSERGNLDEAIEKLKRIQDFTHSSLGVRVAAMEGLVGLHLEMGQDDTSSVLADKCLQLFRRNSEEIGCGFDSKILEARATAVKGLVELVVGNLESAKLCFGGSQGDKGCYGNVALSYGEFLHATGNFSLAKDLYQKVVQKMSETKDFADPLALAACNMVSEEVLLGATCALGQLEAHSGGDTHKGIN